MIGKVYVMFCERARPAGIEVILAGLVDWERSQTTAEMTKLTDHRRSVYVWSSGGSRHALSAYVQKSG